MIPTVIRGHLARPGSPAEAYLVAWSELLDSTPDPDALRAEQAHVIAQIDARHRTRRHLGSMPWLVHLRARIPGDIATAIERHEEAAAAPPSGSRKTTPPGMRRATTL